MRFTYDGPLFRPLLYSCGIRIRHVQTQLRVQAVVDLNFVARTVCVGITGRLEQVQTKLAWTTSPLDSPFLQRNTCAFSTGLLFGR